MSRFTWKATLENVSSGIHAITVRNATSVQQGFTNSDDRFIFRIGAEDNPIVFPQQAMYPARLLCRSDSDGAGAVNGLHVHLNAPGATKWRYSLTWGARWSEWQLYSNGSHALEDQAWSGTETQR